MESHERGFGGCWLPAEVFDLFTARRVNAIEMVLMAVVSSYRRNGRDCWCSNKYLAEELGVGVRAIQLMVRNLQDVGVLRQWRGEDGRRYLAVTWTPPPEGSAKNCATERKKLRPYNTSLQNTQAGPSAPALAGEKNMGLITPTTSTNSPSENHTAWATTLRNALLHKRKATGPWSKKTWANDLRLLEERDGIAQDRINRVLTWYCENIGGEYIPQAFSADGFRKKFIAIETAMGRQRVAVPKEELSPDARRVYDHARTLAWPKGSAAMLSTEVAATLKGYETFYRDIKRAADALSGHVTIKDWIQKLIVHLATRLPTPVSFCQQWFSETSRQVVEWQDWNGDLRSFTWRVNHKRFTAMGRGWCKEWCGTEKHWDALVKEIMDAH